MANRLKKLKAPSWARKVYNQLFGDVDVPSPIAVKHSGDEKDESSGEACVATMCILACFGVVLLGIGIGLYTGFSTNERARRRDEVSGAVEAWTKNEKLQKQLRSATVFVELKTSGCDGTPSSLCPCFNTTMPLKATSTPLDVFKDSADRFKYDQLRLALNTSSLGWQLPVPLDEGQGFGSCQLRVRYLQGGNVVANVETPLMRYEDTNIAGDKCPRSLSRGGNARAEESRACREACSKLNGRYSDLSAAGIYYSCIVPYALNRVCIRAAPSGSDGALEEVILNPAPASGCYAPPDFGKLQLQFGFMFSQVELLGTSSGGGSSGMAVELRSDEDPWLKYLAVTKGTLEFRSRLNPKMSAGLGMMVVGVLLCLLWIPILYYGWRWLFSKERFNCPMGLGETLYDGTHKLAKRFGKDVPADFQWPDTLKDLPEALPKKEAAAVEQLPTSCQVSVTSTASSRIPAASSGSNTSTASSSGGATPVSGSNTSTASGSGGATPVSGSNTSTASGSGGATPVSGAGTVAGSAGTASFGTLIPNPLYRGSPSQGKDK